MQGREFLNVYGERFCINSIGWPGDQSNLKTISFFFTRP